MHQVKTDRRLTRQLVAHVCARPAIIVDLCDAAAFIDMHGVRTRLWVTAEIAVRYADHTPLLIDQATKTLENALRREGMLDQQPVSLVTTPKWPSALADRACEVTTIQCQTASPRIDDWA